ncbi:MAG: hypothetical protein OEY61_00760 [Gammaproteobacteria bacterium]|nr:hypothetical protein [Gammaproteobacteria bacterium]
MKILNYIILLFLLGSSALADTRFDELFDLHSDNASATADSITRFHAENINLSFTEKLTQLNALSQNIDAFIKVSPGNPLLWFMKGLNYSNLASVYNAQHDVQQADLFITQKNQAYAKAIELDTKNNMLTAAIYATMKHGLPEDLKIIAIQKELTLGGNGENESDYWFLHWSNINALQQAGRLEEAQQALTNMKAEMLKQDISNPDYEKLTVQIEQSFNQPTLQINNQKTTLKESSSKQQDSKPDIVSVEDFTWLLIGLVIIALILAWKYEVLIFKKKR